MTGCEEGLDGTPLLRSGSERESGDRDKKGHCPPSAEGQNKIFYNATVAQAVRCPWDVTLAATPNK